MAKVIKLSGEKARPYTSGNFRVSPRIEKDLHGKPKVVGDRREPVREQPRRYVAFLVYQGRRLKALFGDDDLLWTLTTAKRYVEKYPNTEVAVRDVRKNIDLHVVTLEGFQIEGVLEDNGAHPIIRFRGKGSSYERRSYGSIYESILRAHAGQRMDEVFEDIVRRHTGAPVKLTRTTPPGQNATRAVKGVNEVPPVTSSWMPDEEL